MKNVRGSEYFSVPTVYFFFFFLLDIKCDFEGICGNPGGGG